MASKGPSRRSLREARNLRNYVLVGTSSRRSKAINLEPKVVSMLLITPMDSGYVLWMSRHFHRPRSDIRGKGLGPKVAQVFGALIFIGKYRTREEVNKRYEEISLKQEKTVTY